LAIAIEIDFDKAGAPLAVVFLKEFLMVLLQVG
jgi:hypothetical protein